MAFWGVEVKPGKPWTHTFDDSRGKLRITQATLGNGSGEKKSTVQCNVGSRQPVLLCSLLPDKVESCSLELEFEEAEEVVFSVLGPRSVHLTGYFLGCCGARDGDDTDSYGEDIAGTSSEEDDIYESDESYEDDFINDGDIETFSTSPSSKHNSGVVIEEIVDDEGPATASDKQKLLTDPESEDEDGFPVTFKRKSKNNKINKGGDLNDTPDNPTREKDTVARNDASSVVSKEKPSECNLGDDTKTSVNPKKKRKAKIEKGTTSIPSVVFSADKNDVSEKDNEDDDKKGEILDNMNQDNTAGDGEEHRPDNNETSVANSDGKANKKNKKKKKRTEEDTSNDANDIHANATNETNADRSDTGSVGSKKKRKKAKGSDSVLEKGSTEMKTEDIQPLQTRTFPKGFVVEELQMGLPNGKRAALGKKVSVNYIGKLKDGKIFDSNVGKRPFEFRLGVGQVIKGWDIGVDGMRVGDKRRLTIPPSLAYGEKKVGPIPANSTLFFDVELVGVK